jgi:hypothetical protein
MQRSKAHKRCGLSLTWAGFVPFGKQATDARKVHHFSRSSFCLLQIMPQRLLQLLAILSTSIIYVCVNALIKAAIQWSYI